MNQKTTDKKATEAVNPHDPDSVTRDDIDAALDALMRLSMHVALLSRVVEIVLPKEFAQASIDLRVAEDDANNDPDPTLTLPDHFTRDDIDAFVGSVAAIADAAASISGVATQMAARAAAITAQVRKGRS